MWPTGTGAAESQEKGKCPAGTDTVSAKQPSSPCSSRVHSAAAHSERILTRALPPPVTEMLKCTNLDGLIKKRGDVVEDEKTLWAQLGCEEKLKVRLSLHAKFMTDCKLTAALSGALHHVAAKRRRDKRQVRASARKRGHRGGSGLGICLVLRKTPLEGLHVRLPLYCGVVGFLSAGQASDSAFDNNRCWNCTGCRRSRVPRKAQSKTG